MRREKSINPWRDENGFGSGEDEKADMGKIDDSAVSGTLSMKRPIPETDHTAVVIVVTGLDDNDVVVYLGWVVLSILPPGESRAKRS